MAKFKGQNCPENFSKIKNETPGAHLHIVVDIPIRYDDLFEIRATQI